MEKKQFFQNVCRRTAVCSINKAKSLAKQSNYDADIVADIVSREDCSFPDMLELLTKTNSLSLPLSQAVKNKNFKKISFEQLGVLLIKASKEKSDYDYSIGQILLALDEQKILNQFSLEELLALGIEIGYSRPIIDCISRKKSWQEMSFEKAFKLLERCNLYYHQQLAILLTLRRDCPQEKILSFLKDWRHSVCGIFEAMVANSSLSLSFILKEPKELEGITDMTWEELIIACSYDIIPRHDCSIAQAQEILEKTKNYDGEVYNYAVMALMGKSNFSFKKALKLMSEIRYSKDAVPYFEKRSDFTLERRIELIHTMSEAIPEIYMGGDEPNFDRYDLNKIIEKGDWATRPLAEALKLYNVSRFSSSLKTISERADWKKLSLDAALKLAVENGNDSEVLQMIITSKKCSLKRALKLAEIPNSDLYDIHFLRTIIMAGLASGQKALELVKKSQDPSYTVAILVEPAKISLSEMMNLHRNGFSNLINLTSAISKHEDWKTIDLPTAFDYLRDNYKTPLSDVIINREDWQVLPFVEAEKLLQMIDWKSCAYQVVPSLTKKPDCPLKKAKELLKELDPKRDIRQAIFPIVSRLDNSLNDALELSQNSYYGSFEGIVVRQDWKDLPLLEVFRYIERYQKHILVGSLAERTDWLALPFEEAFSYLPKIDSYARAVYVGLIIKNENNPLDKILFFLEVNKYEHLLAHQAIRRQDCSLDIASEIFRKSDGSYSMVEAVCAREDWQNLPLEEKFNFAKKTGLGLYSPILETEDWQNLSVSKSLKIAESHDYNVFLCSAITKKINKLN